MISPAAGMSLKDWLLLYVLSAVWSSSFFFVSIVVHELPPLLTAACRMGLAALIVTSITLASGRRLPMRRGILAAFLFMGFLSAAMPSWLSAISQTQITSGLASILNATTPIWTVLLAHLLTTDEKITPNRLSGVLLGLLGMAIMLAPDLLAITAGIGLGPLFGQGAMLLCALFVAVAGIFGRRFHRLGLPVTVTTSGQLCSAAFFLVPAALIVDRPWMLDLPSARTIAALFGLALISTVAASLLYFRVLARAGSNVNLVTLLVPINSVLLGVLFLGERLEPRHLLGMAAIAAGLIAIDGRLVQWAARQMRARFG